MAFTPAVRGWAASQARLYFFALEVLKYVSFEHAGAAKKRILRICHMFTIQEPLFNQRYSAKQVSDLEQFIVPWLNALGKLHTTPDIIRKCLVQKICHWRLSAIVVDFEPIELPKPRLLRRKKILKLMLQAGDYSQRRGDISLVDPQAMILELGTTSEVKKQSKHFCAPLATKRGEHLFLANQRSGMAREHFWIKPHSRHG